MPARGRRASSLGWLACSVLLSQQGGAAPSEIDPLPLQGHTRTLSFDTDEGTWLSVDATPDGKSVVFDLLGDLYSLPLSGGEATALTHGSPYDSQPRVSPDGEWVAFISDRDGADNLWVLRRADGELRRLSANRHTVSISPSWSPDSRRVLVAETLSYLGEAQFKLYDLSGRIEEVRDKDGHAVNGAGGVLSSDGRYLYFANRNPADESRYGMPIAQIRRLDLQHGTLETLTNGMGGGARPLLSADGRQLVYATREEGKTGLRVRDLETGADRRLLWPVQQDRQDYGRALRGDQLPGYAFTPDQKSLLLSYGGKIRRLALDADRSDTHEIPFRVRVSLDVGPPLRKPFRLDEGPVTARIIHHPSFSPDGRKIVASILTKLYVMPARDGAAPRRLTRGEALEFQPAWSPDGRWIAYIVWSAGEGAHVWKARADGRGAPQRVTSIPAFYTDLVFSPDGNRIVAMRGNERMRENAPEGAYLNVPLDLVWIPVSGGDVHVVAAAYASRYPHFASDPERIYTSDGHALFSVRFDGADQRTHLRIEGRYDSRENRQPTAERIYVQPDGKRALALINKQVWRIAQLPPGKPSSAVVSTAGSDAQTGSPTLKIDVHGENATAVRLTDVGADFFGWSQGGRSIAWAIGSTLYRVPADSAGGRAAEASSKSELATTAPRGSAPDVESFPVSLRVARSTPSGTVVLRGGTVIAMSEGQGAPVLKNADVVVIDNRIAGIGAAGSLRVSADARVIDVAGKYLVPGFIDTHAHWRYPTREIQEPDNWSLRANLAYGVTAGLDVQSNHGDNFAYEDMVDTGQTVGTRAFMVGPGVFGINNYKVFEANFQSYEETLAYLQRYQRHYRTHSIKVYLAGDRRQRQWIALASQQLGLMPTTEGYGDPFMDATHAMDGMRGSEHAFIDSPIYSDFVQLFARTRTSYTPTLTITHYGIPGFEYFMSRIDIREDPKLNRFYPREHLLELTGRRGLSGGEREFSFRTMGAQAASIQRAGGLVGVGSHGEVQGLGYHWEMRMMEMAGMRPQEVLKAATLDGARILGVEQDLGSLEVGKLADLLVLRADPRETIENASQIAYVMQNGRLYDGETLAAVKP